MRRRSGSCLSSLFGLPRARHPPNKHGCCCASPSVTGPERMDLPVPRRGSADSFQAFLAVLSSGSEEEEQQLPLSTGQGAGGRPDAAAGPSSCSPLLPPAFAAAGVVTAGPVVGYAVGAAGGGAGAGAGRPSGGGVVCGGKPADADEEEEGAAAAAGLRVGASGATTLPLPRPPLPAARRGRGRARSDRGPETAQQRAHRRFYVRKKERVSLCFFPSCSRGVKRGGRGGAEAARNALGRRSSSSSCCSSLARALSLGPFSLALNARAGPRATGSGSCSLPPF